MAIEKGLPLSNASIEARISWSRSRRFASLLRSFPLSPPGVCRPYPWNALRAAATALSTSLDEASETLQMTDSSARSVLVSLYALRRLHLPTPLTWIDDLESLARFRGLEFVVDEQTCIDLCALDVMVRWEIESDRHVGVWVGYTYPCFVQRDGELVRRIYPTPLRLPLPRARCLFSQGPPVRLRQSNPNFHITPLPAPPTPT